MKKRPCTDDGPLIDNRPRKKTRMSEPHYRTNVGKCGYLDQKKGSSGKMDERSGMEIPTLDLREIRRRRSSGPSTTLMQTGRKSCQPKSPEFARDMSVPSSMLSDSWFSELLDHIEEDSMTVTEGCTTCYVYHATSECRCLILLMLCEMLGRRKAV